MDKQWNKIKARIFILALACIILFIATGKLMELIFKF